jgi:5-methylthioadenosine/S-adenosylhomocysteine deaminase
MATILGARALGLDSKIGSLESGKLADLILVQADAPHASPMYNVYSNLAYSLKGSDVTDTMVNGRLVVRDRVALTLNAGAILAKAREYRLRINSSLGR